MTTYRKLDKLKPNFRKKVQMFKSKCKDEGLDIFITETWRSQVRQVWLKATGKSWTLKSKHGLGLAIDIAFRGKELYPSDINIWNRVFKIAEYCGMDSGYVLWDRDKPHFQDNGTKFIPETKIKLSLEERRFRKNLEKINSKLWELTEDKKLKRLLNMVNKHLRK